MELQYHILVMTLSGTLMYALFKIFEQLTKRHFSATWHYTVLKFITIFFFIPIGKIHLILVNVLFPHAESVLIAGAVSSYAAGISKYIDNGGIIYYIISGIWLIGMAVILFRQFVCYIRFRYITFRYNAPANIRNQWLAKCCARKLGIKRPVRLYVNDFINTPMLIGFFTPIILIPTDYQEGNNFEFIISHELTHYKNRDLVWKLTFIILRSIHWFNPLIYLLSKDLEKWCEYTCDEKNAINLSLDNKKKYGLAILDAASIMPIYGSNFGTPFLLPNQNLKERLMYMLNVRRMSKRSMLCSAILALALISGGFLTATAGENGNGNRIDRNTSIRANMERYSSSNDIASKNISARSKKSEFGKKLE